MTVRRRLSTTAWVGSTYFAEGYAYMLVRYLSVVFFTDRGVREAYLGFLNFLGIPWNAKFLWAPLVDYFGTKRRWIVAIEALLFVALLAFAGLAAGGDSDTAAAAAASPWTALSLAVVVLVALAFTAATHDVAIDAFYLAALPEKVDQALYSGDRVTAFRVAMIFVRSVFVGAAAYAGWGFAWGLAAATMALLCGVHAWRLPAPETGAAAAAGRPGILSHFGRAFASYLDQPRVAIMLVFVLGYKLGDEILFSMNTPFLLRELGLTKTQLAWLSGLFGPLGTIAGAMAGSAWIARAGLRRTIWPLTLGMNLNIWAYVALAVRKPNPATVAGFAAIAAIHVYEMLAAGLGYAVLTVYLMRTCRAEFKAAHFAIGTALMSVGASVVGGFGGILVERIGYLGLFVAGFLMAIPSMALIPWIPHLEERAPVGRPPAPDP